MNFTGKRVWFLGFSAVLLILSAAFLALPPGLRLGIDFTSGTSMTIEFSEDISRTDLRDAMADAGHGDAVIQSTGARDYFVRTEELGEAGRDDIEAALEEHFGDAYEIVEVTTVGQSVAEGTVQNSAIAVAVAAGFIMLFLLWAFRSVPGAWRYSIGAVVALMHDVVITLGIFAILGRVIGAEVNAPFVVGILTMIGYSVNDSIVVFDRIRENVGLYPGMTFRDVVNQSLNESVMRSLGTSFTTGVVILAMLLFGGATLRDFLLVLLVGVVVGTYSSLFIAAQTVVFLDEGGIRGIFRRNREAGAQAEAA